MLVLDRAVWYGNSIFSIIKLSTQRQYSSFLKNVFVFDKFFSKGVAMKTFKIFRHCRIKICRSLQRRAGSKTLVASVF